MLSTGKFTKITFENFMSLGHVTLEFDEKNIISIAGFNDSGKSAITRGLEVLFYNAYSLDQVKFIKDDTEFFRITIEEDTGFKVIREKHISGKSVWSLMKGEEVVFNNSTGDGKVTYSVSDVPDVIAKFLGVIQDEHTHEKLNVRRNTDKLFLINTTGGDNYKILNTILRSDILSESSRRINEDRNKLQSELGGLNIQAQTLRGEVSKIDVAPSSLLNDMGDNINKLKSSKERLLYVEHMSEQLDAMNSYVIYDEVDSIDTERMLEIENLMRLQKGLDVEIYPETVGVDANRMLDIQNIYNLRQVLNESVPPETSSVDNQRFKDIMELGSLYNSVYNCSVELSKTESELKQVNDKLAELAQQYNYKICSSCGTVVL